MTERGDTGMKTGNKCEVCTHPDKTTIEERMLSGVSVRKLADEFNIGRMSVQRHRQNHLPHELIKSKKLQEMKTADDLVSRIEGLYEKAIHLITIAEQDKKYQPAVSAIKEARSSLELLAKISGELKTGTTINLTYSPQWVNLRAVLVDTLQEYPEVCGKVVHALEEAEKVEVIDC
jgi:hypothetical protein